MRFIGSIFKYIWRIINGLRVVILNIIFFALLVGFIAVLVSEEDPVEVPDNSVLVLNLTVSWSKNRHTVTRSKF